MNRRKIISSFPIIRLITPLILLSVGLQIIIISHMYIFKVDVFAETMQIGLRFIRGIILTFIAAAILAYPSIHLIINLNQTLSWKGSPYKRFFIQFSVAAIFGILVSPCILFPAIWIFGLESDFHTLLSNVYYMVVLAIFVMAFLEARIYFIDSAESYQAKEILTQKLIAEAANKARYKAQIQIEEEKNKYAHKLIEKERQLNSELGQEIEKRKIIAKELNEKTNQLNSILTNLSGAAYRCYFDEQYTMQYISEKIYDISGYHAFEFTDNSKMSFNSIIHSEDKEEVKKKIQESFVSKMSYEIEYRIIHKNGDCIWVNENGKGIYNDNGNIEYLDGIIVDISRRKLAEIAAKESERNYKELMNFLPQPVFELDLQGKILFNNKSGQDFFGLPDPEKNTEKSSALDFFIDEDIPRVAENIKKTQQSVNASPNEYTVKKPDGTLCPVLIYGSPIIRNNKVVGRRGIIIDISERKKHELKLLEAKEELERINNSLEKAVSERTQQLTETNTLLLKVQKENIQSQFEILKQQINPHFLFNSLNVLSSLITKDLAKAQLFIDEFSQIYRYVLETIEKTVVTLGQELSFVRSYFFLQQLRYGENLILNINLDSNLLNLFIPPLSLQVVLENAIKHNVVNDSSPLCINIINEGNWLILSNNVQTKISMVKSMGLGQKNLIKRYTLISDNTPSFQIHNDNYVVKLPLLNIENNESIDY
ncbi:MAG: PAS domain S-box protein [Cyclobacteriaceae bacterium]|nr:PAS domain S-box protein [Cyclobacteriaceae bacterium]